MEAFSADYLTQLNFDRSKKWSTFLEDVAVAENEDDIIDFAENENETAFKDNDNNSDSSDLTDMEDNEAETNDNDIPASVLEDITNCSRMIMMSDCNNTKYINEITIKTNDDDINYPAKQELVDLLNHTIPIINEYKRQMKETGLENILNTFDAKKIEETEGDWIKNRTLIATKSHDNRVNNDNCKRRFKERPKRPLLVREKLHNRKDDDEISSDESLHSCDLARYVRSTKYFTPQVNSLRKIKTFCTVKGKREELRQKYASHPDYDDLYLTALRHRRKHFSFNDNHHDFYYHHHYQFNSGCNLNKLESRKKILRKRLMPYRNFSTESNDTESDEDTDFRPGRNQYINTCKCQRCDCHHHHKNRKLLAKNYNHSEKRQHARSAECNKMKNTINDIRKCYSKQQKRALSTSLSSTSSLLVEEDNETITPYRNVAYKEKLCNKLNTDFMADPRPCKRESECQCYNEEKLCSNYRHLAETSIDEWFVENYFTIKERPSVSSSPTRSSVVLSTAHENDRETFKEIKNKPATVKCQQKKGQKTQKTETKNLLYKKRLSRKQQQNDQTKVDKNYSDSEFETQLQLALTESLKVFKQNSKQLGEQTTTSTITTTQEGHSQCNISKNKNRLKRHNNYDNDKSISADVGATTDEKHMTIVKKLPRLQLAIPEVSKIYKNNKEEKTIIKNKENKQISIFKSEINHLERQNEVAEADESELFNYYTPGIYNSTAITSSTTCGAKSKINTSLKNLSKRQYNDNVLSEKQKQKQQRKSFKDDNGSCLNLNQNDNKLSTTSAIKKINHKKDSYTSLVGTSLTSNVCAHLSSGCLPAHNSIIKCEEVMSEIVCKNNNSDNDERNDMVSSTTQMATATKTKIMPPIELPSIKESNNNGTMSMVKQPTDLTKGILIYCPDYKHQLAPNGYFEVTQGYLSTVIGSEAAKKFFKYYLGRRRFHYTSIVYFRPPLTNVVAKNSNNDEDKSNTNDNGNIAINENSSDDDDDVLECCSKYGYLHESIQSDYEK